MSILEQDPTGRLDIAAVRVAEVFVRGPLEKSVNGLPLWDMGLGQLVEALAVEHLPGKPITAVAVARELGILRRPSLKPASATSTENAGRDRPNRRRRVR